MEKRWQKTEIAHLKRYAKSKTAEELAKRMHTDPATVRRKLKELGLGEGATVKVGDDPVVADYEKGLEHLHAKRWAKAQACFATVVDATDSRQLRDRARQYQAICQQYLEEPAAPEDPYLMAVIEKNRGDFAAAHALCPADAADGDQRYAYLLASMAALEGNAEDAIALLQTAIRLEPKNRVHAFHDPDFESLRTEDAFTQLLANT